MENKAPCGVTGGPDVSRRPKTASAGRPETLTSLVPCGLTESVGVFFPRRSDDRASDTPVANHLFFHPHASSTFVDAATWPRVLSFERVGVGRRMRQLAKTTVVAVS